MFETIMLAGFLGAALSHFLPGKRVQGKSSGAGRRNGQKRRDEAKAAKRLQMRAAGELLAGPVLRQRAYRPAHATDSREEFQAVRSSF